MLQPILLTRDDKNPLARWWWSIDRLSLSLILILILFGSFLVLSSTFFRPTSYALKHAIAALLAIGIIIAISSLSIKRMNQLALLLFIITFIALCLVPVIGITVKGSTRWLNLMGFSLQPSELLKPCFAVLLASLFQGQRDRSQIPGYAIGLLLATMIIGLLMIQTDFGMSFLLLATLIIALVFSGIHYLLVGGLAGLMLIFSLLSYLLVPQVRQRWNLYINPDLGDNYQITTAFKSFYSGGLIGKGLGEGVVKLSLPDAHSDFIFAVVGEELGIIACIIVLGIYLTIFFSCYSRLHESRNFFTVLAGAILLSQYTLQVFINISSSLHLIPTKGLTLPFLSYGGSALLGMALTMGFLLCLTRQRQEI